MSLEPRFECVIEVDDIEDGTMTLSPVDGSGSFCEKYLPRHGTTFVIQWTEEQCDTTDECYSSGCHHGDEADEEADLE